MRPMPTVSSHLRFHNVDAPVLLSLLILGTLFVSTARASEQATHDREATASPGSPTTAEDDPSTVSSSERVHGPRVIRWWLALPWVVILGIALVFGALAIVVFSRRFKAYVMRDARKPTQHVDAWQLHKLPGDWDKMPPPDDGD